MNEALQTQLADIAELAKNGVLQAVEVLRVQMPELCSQVLTYGFWRSVLSVIISLIGIIIFYKVLKYAIITGNKGNWETGTRYEMCIPLMVISILGLSAMVITFFNCFFTFTWLKIALAPKLYLIEYTSALIK